MPMAELVVFVLMGVAALAGAAVVLMARNPVNAAMGLLATLFSMGVLYVVQLAHLVAAVQIIVYAGAVMTLFLFVIMLIGVDKSEDAKETLPYQRRRAAVIGLAVVLVGGGLAVGGRFAWVPSASPDTPKPNGSIQNVAAELFANWVLPFEVTALLLTIAAAGAIALAYYRRHRVGEEVEG